MVGFAGFEGEENIFAAWAQGSDKFSKTPKKHIYHSTSYPMEHAKNFIAGSISGTVSSALLQPLDAIRTVQVRHRLGFRAGLSHVIVEDGVGGLWRGLGATVTRVFWGAGLHLSFLSAMAAHVPQDNSAGAFAVAAFSRSMAATLLNPLSVAKTRIEGSKRGSLPYNGSVSGAAHIFRTEGMAGWARGLGPTVARDAPFSGLFFATYRFYRRTFIPDHPQHLPVYLALAKLGAGATATILVHPVDVLRVRLQFQSVLPQDATSKKSVLREIQSIYSADGPTGFFRGATARVLKRSIATTLSWTIFENLSGQSSGI